MIYRLAGLAVLAFALVPRGLMAQAEPEAYRFIGGEKVQLRFEPPTVGETTLQTVTDEGSLSLPSGNLVSVRGKTPFEARQLIAERVEKETTAKKISVFLLLLEIPPRKIHVAGEVRKPGSISLSPGVPLSLLGALQEAGGIGDKGDPVHVNLVHTDAAGKHEAQIIDTTRLAQPGSAELGPKLQAGDIIVVPRADHYVFVGEFARTGPVALGELGLEPNEKPHLFRVIAGNGGLKREADPAKLQVLRLRPDGSREVLAVDPTKPGDKDILLQNGDIIEVGVKAEVISPKETPSVSITGKVRTPGLYPLGAKGLKLSKLVLLAGGLADFSKGKHVTVNRASEHRLIVVDVDAILKKAAWELDIDLKEGDVVNVPERAF